MTLEKYNSKFIKNYENKQENKIIYKIALIFILSLTVLYNIYKNYNYKI